MVLVVFGKSPTGRCEKSICCGVFRDMIHSFVTWTTIKETTDVTSTSSLIRWPLLCFCSPGITMIWNWKMPSTQPSWHWRCVVCYINTWGVQSIFTVTVFLLLLSAICTPFIFAFQESFEGQMTEENIEVGICNEAGFKRLTPAEVKDYLAAIAWTRPPWWRGFQATFQDKDKTAQ